MSSTARASGSGFITMPGPPPYGTSSTLRWRSTVYSRRSWTLMSSSPRSTPRLITPSASPASTIRGKIVTMSNFIQFEQPLRRCDPNPARGHVDLDADVDRERDQYFTTRALDHQPASAGAAVHPDDGADPGAVSRFHRASGKLVLVVAPRLERLERFFGNSQLESREPLDRIDARQPFEANHRLAVLHPGGRDRELFLASRGSCPHRGAGSKSLGDEIRFRVDDDIAAETVRPRHPADDRHLVPVSHSLRRVRFAEPAPPTSMDA